MIRVSASDREKKSKDSTMDKLISPQTIQSTKSTPVKKISPGEEFKRQTYYLTPELIEAIRVMSFVEGTDKSALIRNLLSESALKKYIGKSLKL